MAKSDNPTLTTLTKDEIARVMEMVKSYLKEHPSISNQKLRALTGIGYDQAIFFFKTMVKTRQLEKSGKSAATIYTLPKTKK